MPDKKNHLNDEIGVKYLIKLNKEFLKTYAEEHEGFFQRLIKIERYMHDAEYRCQPLKQHKLIEHDMVSKSGMKDLVLFGFAILGGVCSVAMAILVLTGALS